MTSEDKELNEFLENILEDDLDNKVDRVKTVRFLDDDVQWSETTPILNFCVFIWQNKKNKRDCSRNINTNYSVLKGIMENF